MTSENDIDIVNMDEQPTAVFVIVPDERFTRHRFVTLFITQMYKELVEKANLNLRKAQTQTAILKRNTYFVLDEFGNLPKFDNIEGMVTVARSRGIRFLFVLQSFSQLNAKYGRDIGDIIKTNCNVKIFIGSDDPDTRKEFSELCGQKKVKNFSVNTNAENPASSNTGASNQPLITVGMLERLNGNDKGDAIVSVRGYEPIWTVFTPSYELTDVYFKNGKADMSKREAVLFDKDEYVFDITGNRQSTEDDGVLEAIEDDEAQYKVLEEQRQQELKKLDDEWQAIVCEVNEEVDKLGNILRDEDFAAVKKVKPEEIVRFLYMVLENYADNAQLVIKIQDVATKITEKYAKLNNLQNTAKKENEEKVNEGK
jgi:type IV secretion system protein VirD4